MPPQEKSGYSFYICIQSFSSFALRNIHLPKISHASSQPQLFYLASVSENSTWFLELPQSEKIAFPEGQHSPPLNPFLHLYNSIVALFSHCSHTEHTATDGMTPNVFYDSRCMYGGAKKFFRISPYSDDLLFIQKTSEFDTVTQILLEQSWFREREVLLAWHWKSPLLSEIDCG